MRSFITGGRLAGLLAATVLAFSLSASAAFADSESGGFIFGGGSESGGIYDTGASSASTGLWGTGESQSGGLWDTGSESESGGLADSGAESESGGLSQTGAESESNKRQEMTTIENQADYVRYYGP